MAWHDWNGDGKMDLLDNMMEYEGYKQYKSSEDDNTTQKRTSGSNGGISTFGAILITILGMFGSGAICKVLDINSGLVIIVIWIVISFLIFWVYRFIKQ